MFYKPKASGTEQFYRFSHNHTEISNPLNRTEALWTLRRFTRNFTRSRIFQEEREGGRGWGGVAWLVPWGCPINGACFQNVAI